MERETSSANATRISMQTKHEGSLPEGDMTIAQPFRVGFQSTEDPTVPNGTADLNYKAFLFQMT